MKIFKSKLFHNGIGLDTFLLAFTRVITLVSGIITTRILSTQLSLSQYGTYSEALTLISVITSITIFGLVDSAIYFYNSSKDEKERQKTINTIFFIETILSGVVAILVLSCSGIITRYFSNPNLFKLMIIIVLEPFIDNTFNLISILFVAQGRSKLLAFRNGIMSLIRLGIVCVGIFLFHSVFAILMLMLITNTIQMILFWLWYKKYSHFINIFNIDGKKIKTILGFAVSIFLIIITNTLMKQCDKLVLGNLVSVEDMAVFENASKQLPFDIIVSAIGTVSAPLISKFVIEGQSGSLEKLLKPFHTICFFSLMIFAFPAILCHKEFMLFLYGEKYAGASYIFIVYTVAEIIKFSNISIIIVTKNRKMELALVSLACLVFNVGLDKLLFNYFGMIGCAFGTLTITALLQLYILIRSSSLMGVKIMKMIDLKVFAVLIIECSIIGMFLFFTKKYIEFHIANYLFRLLILYIPIVVLLLLLNIKILKNSYMSINTFSLRREENEQQQ